MYKQEPIIELKNISVTFQTKEQELQAVKDVSLSVKKGDVFGIMGYSGAGKSTLVRVINLLQRPTAGQVIVSGQDLLTYKPKQLREARQKIGMIFQHFNLMASRTVFGNVEFPLLNSQLNAQQRHDKVLKLLDLVGLSDKVDTYPSQLSGGQKQRVAIARALANDPQILISDEATSALDPETTTDILNLLKYLNQKLQITIVIITHEMDAIKQICNYVAVMDQGELIEQGSVLDIFGHPKQQLTQKFVASATRLDNVLEEIKHQQLVDSKNYNLVELDYFGDVTGQPIVVELYQRFGVTANILFSNIEQIQGTTVGIMLLELSGPDPEIESALDYLNHLQVTVKQIDLDQIEVN
ncbi:methionine ABC transporter ATP-binding protein [Bombilactobacillus folatiphilus]